MLINLDLVFAHSRNPYQIQRDICPKPLRTSVVLLVSLRPQLQPDVGQTQ